MYGVREHLKRRLQFGVILRQDRRLVAHVQTQATRLQERSKLAFETNNSKIYTAEPMLPNLQVADVTSYYLNADVTNRFARLAVGMVVRRFVCVVPSRR